MARDWTLFDEFLWDCFREGQCSRELRLTQEELAYLAHRYPLASYHTNGQDEGDKCWYSITLQRNLPLESQGA